MINTNDIQSVIISTLKADTTLTTALGGDTEIREDDWPGPDWNFPCVRVAINTTTPISPGKCHLTELFVTFSIFVFTQPSLSVTTYDASSLQCSNLMDNVVEAIFGQKIESSGLFVAMTAVNVTGQNAPVPEFPPGGWRGEVLCEMTVLEV